MTELGVCCRHPHPFHRPPWRTQAQLLQPTPTKGGTAAAHVCQQLDGTIHQIRD